MQSARFVVTAAALFGCGAAVADGASYNIDPTHTAATFEILHFGTSTLRGRFDRKAGQVQFDRAGKTGRVELTLEMGSVNTGVAAFDRFLQGKEMFNAADFPTAHFVGDSFAFSGDKVSAVSGTLTLLGKTNPVTLQASHFNCYINPLFRREVCGGDFEATIQRSQWGLNYGNPAYAPDSVRLLIQVEAIKQQ
jgi:polyisoprenoid-binding protein YceI